MHISQNMMKSVKKKVILLMITDGKKWHYLAVKKLSALFRGVTSNHVGDFYCLNWLHSYGTEIKLKKNENVCKNHDYSCAEMPNEVNKILKHNFGEKSMKVPFIIYAELEFFDLTKNKLKCYRGKDCMERFCKDLKEHVTKIIDYEKKKK